MQKGKIYVKGKRWWCFRDPDGEARSLPHQPLGVMRPYDDDE